MDFKKSETYKNLEKAYDGELLAGTKYRIYSRIANKDGFRQIGNIFEETAKNEQEHAEIWLRMMNEGALPMLDEILNESQMCEKHEWTEMYRDYAETAEKEGFFDIPKLFRNVGQEEGHHDFRFRQLAENLRNGEVFCKEEEEVWVCLNCGYVHFGKCAPEKCPACGYPQGYFALNCENY